MTIDFRESPRASELRARTEKFVREAVIPVEERVRGNVHDVDEATRLALQRAAKEAGVFAPHAAPELGGHGLDMRDRAGVFEAAGYSLLGPLALNIAAPDEGNVHLLERVATAEQKARFLAPLADGSVRSCFAMTEPAPGAGADPTLLRTTATRVDGGYRSDGRKWFITGANGAGFAIVMARTSGEPGDRHGGATMFLVPGDHPGMRRVRDVPTLDDGFFGGHSELVFEGCVVGPDAVLGEVDRGFEYAQVRLGPARMTHCMRWLGIAQRAQDIAVRYAADRPAFGSRLAELGMVQQMIADSEIDLEASRALVLKACFELDEGRSAAQSTSIAKTFVAEAVGRVVDRAVQIGGAFGISGDTLLARYFREVRPFRIYDGPSETHRWAIAKRVVRKATSRGGASE